MRHKKEERIRSEREMMLMKSQMSELYKKMISEKKVIERTYEEFHVIERHHHQIVTNEVRVVQDPAQKAAIQHTLDKISSFEKYMKSFGHQISKAEAAQKASDELLSSLQKESKSLFLKSVENSQRITSLEGEIEAKFEELQSEVSKVSVQLQVSEQSSRGDLTRLDTLLQQVMHDLSSETNSRSLGDTQAKNTVMLRVQSLISEVKSMSESSHVQRSSSSSISRKRSSSTSHSISKKSSSSSISHSTRKSHSGGSSSSHSSSKSSSSSHSSKA